MRSASWSEPLADLLTTGTSERPVDSRSHTLRTTTATVPIAIAESTPPYNRLPSGCGLVPANPMRNPDIGSRTSATAAPMSTVGINSDATARGTRPNRAASLRESRCWSIRAQSTATEAARATTTIMNGTSPRRLSADASPRLLKYVAHCPTSIHGTVDRIATATAESSRLLSTRRTMPDRAGRCHAELVDRCAWWVFRARPTSPAGQRHAARSGGAFSACGQSPSIGFATWSPRRLAASQSASSALVRTDAATNTAAAR